MISIGSNSSVFVPRHSWSWKRVPAIGKRGWRWRTATANSPAGAAQGHGSGPVCVRCGAAGGLAQLQGEIRAQLSAGPKPVPTAAADRGPRAVCSNQPRRLAWPSYERCLEGAPESTSGGEGGGESAESAAEIRSRCDNHRDETERQAEPAGADAAAAAANGDRAEGLLADDERHGPLRKLRRLAGQSAHPHRD